ncbi:MAG: 4-hydroxy-3-methylbut-2-enyl diphosphate reductase [Chlamydiae bacterium]|nr:4-hydroxy-3-methylbut-2-enyl diphosphate reductase [Chlamydiota bacterium]
MELVLVAVRGFCAGVVRAIDTVYKALELYGAPVYVKHKIVHNHYVVAALEKRGAIFVDDLDRVPEGSILIFSAHGVPPSLREKAKSRNLRVIDATCGLVTRIHSAVLRFKKMGIPTVVIGHKNHVEIVGVTGESLETTFVVEKISDVDLIPFDPKQPVSVVTQTTLSLFDLQPILNRIHEKFSEVKTLPTSSICYATTNRQQALLSALERADLVLVVGDRESSNAVRLTEIALHQGVDTQLISKPDALDKSLFEGKKRVVLTSGASVPEKLFLSIVQKIESLVETTKISFGEPEQEVFFELPASLWG